MKKLLLVLVLMLLLTISFDAPKSQKTIEYITLNANGEAQESSDVDDYLSNAVDDLLNGLDFTGVNGEIDFGFAGSEKSFSDIVKEYINGDFQIDYSNLFSSLISIFFSGIRELIGEMAVISAVALFYAIFSATFSQRFDKGLSDVIHFACFSVVVGIVTARFGQIFIQTRESIEKTEKVLEVVFPILLTIMSASGQSAGASVFEPQVAFLVKGMALVVKNLLLPITVLIMILSVVSKLSNTIKLDKMRDFLKSVFKWTTGFTAVIFNFFVTTQGFITSVYDGVSIKALKYALGNSIPLVGNLVSGGFDVVLASLILIKNAVGGLAMIVILFTALAPILKIVAFSLFLKLITALIEPICDARMSSALSAVSESANYLVASVALAVVSYMISLFLIVCSLSV